MISCHKPATHWPWPCSDHIQYRNILRCNKENTCRFYIWVIKSGEHVASWRLRWPFLQGPSCGAGLVVWPPYAGVLGPACRRSPTTWRAVQGTGRGWAEGVRGWSLGDVGGGQLLHQHCTRRTRAEQDPAGEWGAFSKERSTGAPFSHTPLTLSSSVSPPRPPPLFLPSPPLPSVLGRLIHWLKCDFLVVFPRWNRIPLTPNPLLPHYPPIPPTLVQRTYSPLELNWTAPLCFSIILSTSKSLMSEREKEEGARNKTNLLGFWRAQCLSFEFPPYIADRHAEWCPWWSVVFVAPCMHSKEPGDTFFSFCLWLQSYLERYVWEWRNLEGGHQVQWCLPAFSPSEGALKIWSHRRA